MYHGIIIMNAYYQIIVTVDKLSKSVDKNLSYLEFYNCCYGVQDICHNTMDPIGQLLQVTK